ncbi:hypothetical protein SPRG_03633 [Saprolegnia parasitica CBS 223.65]|uniref:Fibronectin type-III domain-containing protein n=1 Tax=Saprolegnia parasitica (strain CBS 223.65) TaxID=695850 RepID=A0A067CR66_SAPPC|nr:hypothetical protein SPRG_03633 [Saprolegnia parasitica CBS 223.65]KDO31715.1 hypothetical protein SPRG_03633 [Saprolegnia parasitica CBS 223.65]|eukprot:XP_012197598.1 hypothetical protein SPRG_03633 [Saprolegnia parasitica CBS 223.65]
MASTWRARTTAYVLDAFAVALLAGAIWRTPSVVATMYLLGGVAGCLTTFAHPALPPTVAAIAAASLVGYCMAAAWPLARANVWFAFAGVNVSTGNILVDVAVAVLGLAQTVRQRQASPRPLQRQVSGVAMLASLLERVPTLRNAVHRLDAHINLQALVVLLNQAIIGGCLFIAALATPGVLGGVYYLFGLGRVVQWTFVTTVITPPPPLAVVAAPPSPPRIITTLHKALELHVSYVGIATTSPRRRAIGVYVQRGDEAVLVGATETQVVEDVNATFHAPVHVPLQDDEVLTLKVVVLETSSEEASIDGMRRVGQCTFRSSTLLAKHDKTDARFQLLASGAACGHLGVRFQTTTRIESTVEPTMPPVVARQPSFHATPLAEDFFTDANIPVLLVLNVACLLCAHVYQYPLMATLPDMSRVGEILGFNSQASTLYVSIAAQVGLFLSAAKLRGFYVHASAPTANALASSLPDFIAKLFCYDLVAVAVAVFWCISYPSYVSAGLFGITFLYLGLYGVQWSATPLLVLMTSYSLVYAASAYLLLLPSVAAALPTYYATLGYNDMDVGLQTICALVLCGCHRTRRVWYQAPCSTSVDDNAADATSHFARWLQDMRLMALCHVDKMVLFTILVLLVVLSTAATLFQAGFLILATYLSLYKAHRQRLWRGLLLYSLLVCFAVYTWNITCPTPETDATLYTIAGLTCYRDAKVTIHPSTPSLVVPTDAPTLGPIVLTPAPPPFTLSAPATTITPSPTVTPTPTPLIVLYNGSGSGNALGMIIEVGVFNTTAPRLGSLWTSSLFNAQLLLIAQVVAQLVLYNKHIHLRAITASKRPWFYVSRFALEIDRAYRLFGVAVNYVVLLALALVYERTSDGRYATVVGCVQLLLLAALLDSHLSNLSNFPRGTPHYRRLWRLVLIVELLILVLRYVYQFEPVADVILRSWSFPYCNMEDIGFRRLASNTELSGLFLYLLPTCGMAGLAAWQLAAMDKNIHVHRVFRTATCAAYWQYALSLIHAVSHSSLLLHGRLCVFLIAICATPHRRFDSAWPYLFSLALLALLVLYSVQLRLDVFANADVAATRRWLGFARLDDDAAVATTLWRLGRAPVLMIVLCSLQRVAAWLVPASFTPPPAVSSWGMLLSRLWTRPLAISVLLFSLVVSAFVHLNVLSLGYLLLVHVVRRADWTRDSLYLQLLRRLTPLLMAISIAQYALLLWVPSWLLASQSAYLPWSALSPALQQWLFLRFQHKWSLITDFTCLVCLALLPRPSALTVVETYPETIQRPHALWTTLSALVLHYSVPTVLVYVFVTGCAQFGVASGVYLAYSIYLLFHLDRNDLQPKLLRSLMGFNWLYLFALLVYQMPWLHDTTEACDLGTRSSSHGVCLSVPVSLGLYKAGTAAGTSESASPPTLSIVMFFMLLLQAQILDSPAYADVLQHHRSQLERCQKRGFLLNDAIAKDRILQWRHLKQEKQAAIQRLKVIVSKLVNKVEEMMDIAMGLHYSLPPVAPARPRVVATSQNSVTLHWAPPESKIHKIRSYRITRQVFPSLTLLGDFGDVVTVKAHSTTCEIKNLRPDTTYQFKVAAVSRMGEGPFSAPSAPASTIALNWGDTCTGGWLRTRKTVPRHGAFLRLSTYFPSLQTARYMLRYVVVDGDRLTLYRSEVVAMKHRDEVAAQPTLRRKRALQTKKEFPSFCFGHVASLDLTEHQHQLDEMSPKMYCIEVRVVVPAPKGPPKTRTYSFQPESTATFDTWVAALAYGAPPLALGPHLLAYLGSKHLKIPAYFLAPPATTSIRRHSTQSDLRSLESPSSRSQSFPLSPSARHDSLLSVVDAPPPARAPHVLWLLQFYAFLYTRQDVALQHETRALDLDQIETLEVPSMSELRTVLVNVLRSHSGPFCYLSFIAAFAFQADALNAIYVVALFFVVLCENPRPSAYLWKWILKYSFGALFVRYVFQLPFFCHNYTQSQSLYPSMQPFCPETQLSLTAVPFQPIVLVGLYKYDGSANVDVTTKFQGLQWTFLVICTVLFHRRELQIRGFWVHTSVDASTKNDEDDLAALKALPRWQYVMQRYLIKRPPRPSEKKNVDGPLVSNLDLTRLHLDALQAIEETEAQNNQNDTDTEASQSTLSRRRTRRHDSTDSLNGNQFELADFLATSNTADVPMAPSIDEHATVAHHTREDALLDLNNHVERLLDEGIDDQVPLQLHPLSPSFDLDDDDASDEASDNDESAHSAPTRFRALVGREAPTWVVEYYKHLLPSPPVDWDKDIKKAALGTKPGRDYSLASFGACVLCMAFAVLFFRNLGDPPVPGAEPSSVLSLSSFNGSMLSGYMVGLVFFQVAVIIWDRVAYVYGSLHIKLCLHYFVVLCVHVLVWLVLPTATTTYLPSSPSLMVYYGLQCIYLVLSSQQIKYGYVVFRGNPLSIRQADALTKSTFGIYLATPFAFEMRALLDYICSTTALDLRMWLTLEGIAAHLFQVKLSMDTRVEQCDILTGNQRQPMKSKLQTAGVYFAGILVCLVAPLALFSTANPTTVQNAVLQASAEFGLVQSDGTFQQLYTKSNTNPASKLVFTSAIETYAQDIVFASYSDNLWSSSPPLRRKLMEKLNSTDAIQWKLTLTFTRPAPQGQQAVSHTWLQNVTAPQRQLMSTMMNVDVAAQASYAGGTSAALRIPNMYPSVLNVAATSSPQVRAPFLLRTIEIQRFSEASSGSYWSLVSLDTFAYANASLPVSNATAISCPASAGFCLITVSDNIVPGLNSIGIGSYGITATYVFVLFTIGAHVKSILRGNVSDILYTELPNPDDLMDLVEGIYIARKEEYVGHLKDEARLFETLIRVLRSPETLLKVTGPNVIHIPHAKEKVD